MYTRVCECEGGRGGLVVVVVVVVELASVDVLAGNCPSMF
jgi:hypothetical protein